MDVALRPFEHGSTPHIPWACSSPKESVWGANGEKSIFTGIRLSPTPTTSTTPPPHHPPRPHDHTTTHACARACGRGGDGKNGVLASSRSYFYECGVLRFVLQQDSQHSKSPFKKTTNPRYMYRKHTHHSPPAAHSNRSRRALFAWRKCMQACVACILATLNEDSSLW